MTLTDAFLSHRRSLVRNATRILHDPQAAEDVAQETFIQAQRAVERGAVEHIEALLYKISRNLALNWKRCCDRRNRLENGSASEDIENIADPVASVENALLHRQRLQHLEDAMASLPDRARKVWILSRLEKWPYPKIAAHLGVSPGTVFNDLKHAHAHCLEALAKIDRS